MKEAQVVKEMNNHRTIEKSHVLWVASSTKLFTIYNAITSPEKSKGEVKEYIAFLSCEENVFKDNPSSFYEKIMFVVATK
jgi:hypothetical protein